MESGGVARDGLQRECSVVYLRLAGGLAVKRWRVCSTKDAEETPMLFRSTLRLLLRFVTACYVIALPLLSSLPPVVRGVSLVCRVAW